MRFVAVVLLFLKLTRAVDHVEDDDDDDDYDTEEDEVGVRSAFDMFTRRLPGSIMLATSGNETGTILGTWSTNAIASTVFQFYQEESVIANGHDFGGWIMGGQSYFTRVKQQMSFKALESSKYTPALVGMHEVSKDRLDIGLLMTRLWTSAIVRDNIVTVFGFILNRPNNILPAELYASLTILYNVIRLRRIHTLDVLPVLKRMSFSPPQEQFIVLFEELHRHAPAYLKSIIGVWVDALTEHRIDLNPIIRPGRGPSEVDFLASLEPSDLNVLEEPMFYKRETVERASTTLKVLMGPLFSYVFSGLYDRSIELTQPLFALILLHLPLDQIVPQKDETERFVVDALRLNAIKHWDEVVGTLSEADILDPFRLVTAVLQGIANNKNTDQQVRHDSLYILPYIKASTSTYANENYAIMSEVVGSPNIKFKLLLDHITRLTYSQDMLSLKDRLLDYILNGHIALDSAITGFIRYDYASPYDVMIAVLTRIQRRLPNLSGDMLGTVKALRVHLVFHKALSQTTRRFPEGLIHFPSLIDAFYDSSLPVKVQRMAKSLRGLLDEEIIDWESLVGDMPVAFCTAPRQCFLAVLRKAIDKNLIVDSKIAKLAEKIFNVLDENGNVKDTSERIKCEPMMSTVQTSTIASPVAQVNTSARKYEPTVSIVQTPTTTAPLVQVNTSASIYEPIGSTIQTPSNAAPVVKVSTSASTYEPIGSTVQPPSNAAPVVKVKTSASTYEPIGSTIQTPSNAAPVVKVNTSASTYELIGSTVQTPSNAARVVKVNTSASTYEPIVSTVQTPTTAALVVKVNTSASTDKPIGSTVQIPSNAAPVVKVNTSSSTYEPIGSTVQTPTLVAQVNIVKVPKYLSSSAVPTIVAKDTSPKMTHTLLPHDVLNSTVPNNASLLDVILKVPQLQIVFEIIKNNTIPELHQLIKYFRNKTRAEALLILLESFLHYIPVGSNNTLVGNIVDFINILVANYGLSRISDIPKLYPLPPLGTEFPAINPSIFCLTANFEQRESLLPYTTPFTPKDILMKPIRDFITQADLLNILDEDFKPSEYPTKFLLLCAILEKAIATHVVQEDFYLHNLLSRYFDYLKDQAEKVKPSVKWMVVLDALPYPKDDHEYTYFKVLREFIMSTDMEKYIETFEVRRYSTRGQLLQNYLRHLLSVKQIKERAELIAAIKYFVDKVYLDGFGAKAVEYVIIKQHITRRTIDLQKAFQAIALNKLNLKARKALKGVYKFFEKEFQPPIHLANYDLMKHKTKGEWLKAYFTYLADHPAVSIKARDSISAIIPYILLTGPGAENVD